MNLGNNLSSDELIEFDVKEIEEVIKNTNEEKEAKINWTNAWSKKYPVLAKYQDKVIRIAEGKVVQFGKNRFKKIVN